MLDLLQSQQFGLFAVILFCIVFSLTFHEFGHAWTAKRLGDDTAERMGRLNLNPINHIDPMGLLLVVLVGFGYARPVPVNPANFTRPWADAAVAAAGPFMNLAIAVLAINLLVWGRAWEVDLLTGNGAQTLLLFLAQINVLLMLFNLIPMGPLDGHYIMEWLLPRRIARSYSEYNRRFGAWVFLGLIVLSIAGLPIFRWLIGVANGLLPWLVIG